MWRGEWHAYLDPEEALALCLLPYSRQELQNSGCIRLDIIRESLYDEIE